MDTFYIGDRVEWSSSASGITKTKQGEIVAVVKAGRPPKMSIPSNMSSVDRMFDGLARGHDSYLVLVMAGKTGKTKRLYWPRVNGLKKI